MIKRRQKGGDELVRRDALSVQAGQVRRKVSVVFRTEDLRFPSNATLV